MKRFIMIMVVFIIVIELGLAAIIANAQTGKLSLDMSPVIAFGRGDLYGFIGNKRKSLKQEIRPIYAVSNTDIIYPLSKANIIVAISEVDFPGNGSVVMQMSEEFGDRVLMVKARRKG